MDKSGLQHIAEDITVTDKGRVDTLNGRPFYRVCKERDLHLVPYHSTGNPMNLRKVSESALNSAEFSMKSSNRRVPQPKKASGTSEPPSHEDLHRELLMSHKRGLVPNEKSELQRVMEQRRLEKSREQEEALKPPSDLEQELRKRQLKLQEYEQEEQKQKENEEDVPEFVRVREKLRHLPVSEQ